MNGLGYASSEVTKATVPPQNVRVGPASVALMRRARRGLYLFILYRTPIMRPFEVLAVPSNSVRLGWSTAFTFPQPKLLPRTFVARSPQRSFCVIQFIDGGRVRVKTARNSRGRSQVDPHLVPDLDKNAPIPGFGGGTNHLWISISARSPTNVIYLSLPSRSLKTPWYGHLIL